MGVACSLCGRRGFLGLGWYEERGTHLCPGCWPSLGPTAEWFEQRYAVLQGCIGSTLAAKLRLFRPLGPDRLHLGVEDGKWLTERVIEHLGLPGGDIQFQFKQLETHVAGTVERSGTGYVVKMSQDLEDNFRALSAVLIHELMHIYLANHGLCYKSHDEREELTDLSCVLLGFGLPMVNAKRAWRVDRTALGGGGVGRGTSYHAVGYLSEEQIGYAFAYFVASNSIPLDDVWTGIDPQCWHIVSNGVALDKKYHSAVIARRKARQFLSEQFSRRDICEFSCPVCFLRMAVPRETVDRIGILEVDCRRCGSKIYFDGERIVRFVESLK